MFPIIRKPGLKRAYFGDNNISQDCVGMADYILIDSSLSSSFVNCLSSPPTAMEQSRELYAELSIHHFKKFYIFFRQECYHVDFKYVVSLSK